MCMKLHIASKWHRAVPQHSYIGAGFLNPMKPQRVLLPFPATLQDSLRRLAKELLLGEVTPWTPSLSCFTIGASTKSPSLLKPVVRAICNRPVARSLPVQRLASRDKVRISKYQQVSEVSWF